MARRHLWEFWLEAFVAKNYRGGEILRHTEQNRTHKTLANTKFRADGVHPTKTATLSDAFPKNEMAECLHPECNRVSYLCGLCGCCAVCCQCLYGGSI